MNELHLVYDVFRLDEKLLLNSLEKLGFSPRLVNLEKTPLTSDCGSAIGVIRAAARHRVIPAAFTYEKCGGSVNSFTSLVLSHDKWLSYIALKSAGIPVPETYLAFSVEAAEKAAELIGYPVILKPSDGSWGRFVSLVKGVRDLAAVVGHGKMSDNITTHAQLVQKYLDKGDRDIRVIVVEDRAVAAIYRISDRDWRTNTARGGRAEPARLSPELEDLAVRASRALGLTYSGVDIVETRDGAYVLEVNGVTEFKNVQRVTGIDVAGEIADAIKRMLKI